MQKDKFLILCIIILFALNIFTLTYILTRSEGPPPHHFERNGDIKRPGRPDEVIIDRLNLNEIQVKQFDELKKEHRGQVELLQKSSKELHDEYFGLLKNDRADSLRASELLERIANNQKELDKVTFAHFEKIKGICSSDQKELFNRFIEEIAASFKPSRPPK